MGGGNTATVLVPFQPAAHTTYNAQKPKVSVRWRTDPKYIGALTSTWSSEHFSAPRHWEAEPAGTQDFHPSWIRLLLQNPPAFKTQDQVEERIAGNPFPGSGV